MPGVLQRTCAGSDACAHRTASGGTATHKNAATLPKVVADFALFTTHDPPAGMLLSISKLAFFEALHAAADVLNEIRLAKLAIADDVHTAVELFSDHVCNLLPQVRGRLRARQCPC